MKTRTTDVTHEQTDVGFLSLENAIFADVLDLIFFYTPYYTRLEEEWTRFGGENTPQQTGFVSVWCLGW